MTFPIEFLVLGRPATVNRRKTIAAWKGKVAASASAGTAGIATLPSAAPAMVKVFWFPANRVIADVDNGIKATIDGMAKIVLDNDKQVERVVAQRIVPGAGLVIQPGANVATLLQALAHQMGDNGIREFATAVKVEPFLAHGGHWW